MEKQRPKCIASIDLVCDDERCKADPDCDCAANDCGTCKADEYFFTTAEKVAALMEALEKLGYTVTTSRRRGR